MLDLISLDLYRVFVFLTTIFRSIFDRVLSLNISPKKMKPLIKKYLLFEKQNGTEEDLKLAKERITRYVNDNDQKDADHQDDFDI